MNKLKIDEGLLEHRFSWKRTICKPFFEWNETTTRNEELKEPFLINLIIKILWSIDYYFIF